MTSAAWLRFAELSVLAGWLAWRLYRPARVRRVEAIVPAAAAALTIAQLLLEAQRATDALTPLSQILMGLLTSAYGALSASVLVVAVGLAVWLALSRGDTFGSRRLRPAATAGLVLLFLAGAAAAGAQPEVSALAASGEVAMSPTLTVPRSALGIANPYAGDPASAARGKVVYQQNCQACHGIDGDGRGPAGANLRIHPPTFHNPQHFLAPGMDGAHFWVVQHGDSHPGGMPSWQGTLTDQQIWDAINYVKQIAAGTANTTPAAFRRS